MLTTKTSKQSRRHWLGMGVAAALTVGLSGIAVSQARAQDAQPPTTGNNPAGTTTDELPDSPELDSPEPNSPEPGASSSSVEDGPLNTTTPTPRQSDTPELLLPSDDRAVPENVVLPEDIATPPAPPRLEVPEDAEPVKPVPAASLRLPNEPLEVRVETTQGYSIDDVLELALEQNPEIEQARLDVDSARKALQEVQASYRPQLQTQTQLNYSRQPETDDGTGGPFELDTEAETALNGNLRVDYTIIDGGGRSGRLEAAQRTLEAAEFTLDTARQSIRLEAAEAYYLLQQADAQVVVSEAALEDSRASLRETQALERAGIGTRFEVLQQETEVANDLQNLFEARNNQRVSRFNLASILNFDATTEVTATDPIQPTGQWELSLEESIVQAFNNRPEFNIERQQSLSNEALARQELSATRPSIGIFASYDYADDLDNDFSIDDGYTLGITLGWTLYDGGAALARAQQRDIAALRDASQFEQTRNEIRRSVEDAFFSLNSSRDRIETSKVAIASANEQLRLARLRFQAGVGTQTDVINAQSALTTARGNLANAVTDYNLNIVRLERSVNNL